MPGRSAQSRKWVAGALHAARAAAFLTIATGVNGTLSAVWPHYEPIYAYLAAVVVVAFLSSALLGITAAVAAVILYDWMFSPVHVVPSMSIAMPMAVAVLIAIATRAAVAIRERPALAPPVSEPPLLPVIDPFVPVPRTMPLDVRIDDERVASLTQQLSIARSRFEDEARSRSEREAAAQARQEELEREVESLQARVVDQSNHSLASRREFEEMREKLKQAETRSTALQQGLEVAQKRADEEHARAARETTMREQLEVAGHESLQKAVTDLSTKYEAALLESKQRLEVASKRLDNTQKELKDARAIAERESALRVRAETVGAGTLQKNLTELTAKYEAANANAQKLAEAATGKINVLQRELDRTLASLSQEHNRADREARLRTQLETAARETLHRTADVSASHQRDALEARGLAQTAEERAMNAEQQTRAAEQRAAAAQERTRAADERARVAEARVLALEQQFEQLRFELSELRTSHDEKEGLAASAEDRVFALQSEIDQLRGTQGDQLRGALEARASLQSEIDQVRGTHGDQLREAVEARLSLQKELDATKRELAAEVLRDELETAGHAKLAADLAAANNELQAVRAQRDAAAKSFDEKLRSIIDGINADYESAIGEALVEKEALKAELRGVTKKTQETQTLRTDLASARRELETFKAAAIEDRDKANRAFDEKLQSIVAGISADYENAIGDSLVEKEAAKAEMRTMTKKIQELQQKLDEEKRSRERLDAEWGEKLQKIVTHLAEDHEADIGEAMVTKEAAKAELRTMTSRAAALQQRLDEEREKFRQAADRWKQDRAGGVRKITPTVAQELPPAAPPVPPIPPIPGRPIVVLVVHSDAGTRAMSKHSLQQAGYNVLTAADGLEGLRTATQYKPDVVLTQSVMPKMNARELVQLLKSRRETADVKVILLSNGTETERGSDFRADEIVRDSDDFNDVRAALASVLARRGVAS
jgi:CheY-like chemotaxis protein